MSEELHLVNYVSEEYKRRKRRRIVLMKQYFESSLLAMAYLSTQRLPRDLGTFTDDEHKLSLRKYWLKDMYDETEIACYYQIRLTKRNFHDMCAMLRGKCGLRDSVYVVVDEKVAMFFLVVGHGLKMRLLLGQYKRSLWTISSHFSEVLKPILCLHGGCIKLLDPSVESPNDYKRKWFPDALGALDDCHIDVIVDVGDQGRYRNRKQAITTNVLGVVDWTMKFLYVIHAALDGIPDFSQSGKLRVYGELILSELFISCTYGPLVELRKQWLLRLS